MNQEDISSQSQTQKEVPGKSYLQAQITNSSDDPFIIFEEVKHFTKKNYLANDFAYEEQDNDVENLSDQEPFGNLNMEWNLQKQDTMITEYKQYCDSQYEEIRGESKFFDLEESNQPENILQYFYKQQINSPSDQKSLPFNSYSEEVHQVDINDFESETKDDLKNLLVNIKKPILKYLQKYPEARNHPIVRYLNEKPSINRQDYQNLFSDEDPYLQEAFQKLFKSKFLYRDMQLTRARSSTLQTYLKYIRIFERAYQKKKFPRIK